MKHLTVTYNKENDTLEYNRKLQDGSGDSMYGLEVCKSMHLPSDFLDLAHSFRRKRNPETEDITKLKSSRYNKKKIKGNCQICKIKKASEVHHLQYQKNANDDGFIDYFHKNHVANLISICNDCHNKIHETDKQHKIIKTTKGYLISEI